MTHYPRLCVKTAGNCNKSYYLQICVTSLWPETSTAQVVAADDRIEKQPRTIKESVCQHQMEAGNKRAKKLSKRRNLESEAECGISAFLLLFTLQNAIHWRQKENFS